MPTVPVNGHCFCGAVRWSAASLPTRNLVCHCESCRRATSSPFTAFIGFQAGDVVWTGRIEHYESSPATWRGFCPACGTRLYFRSGKWPEEIHIHAATLDDENPYRPDAQVMLAEKAGWLDGLADLPRHEGFQVPPKG